MKTAIDSSVCLLILSRQPGWQRWQEAISAAATEGSLLVCPIVFAECSMGYASSEVALADLATLNIHYDPLTPETAWLAGQTFLKYRRDGGPREHFLPDFMVAAHATLQADRLAAVDRGYQRTYFPDLQRLTLRSTVH